MILHRFFVSALALLLAACGMETTGAEGHDDALLDASASALATIATFQGQFDAASGRLTVTLDEPSTRLELLTTVRQRVGFCDALLVGSGGLAIASVPGSIRTTVEECILSEEERSAWSPLFYEPGGAFCATVSITNEFGFDLTNLIAEVSEITPGYDAYRFLDVTPPCCGTGADLRGLTGQNVPTDVAGGAFLQAATVASGASADAQWTFQNAGGSFVFRGAFVGQITEVNNGQDDDCDGRSDNSLAEYLAGETCREDADCASGICESISLITGNGICTTQPCTGRGSPDAVAGTYAFAGDPGTDCDPIEDGVCLTRGAEGGALYNAAVEESFDRTSSPADTFWFTSTCDDAPGPAHESWGSFTSATSDSPPTSVGSALCMRGPSGTRYDFVLTDWTRGLGEGLSGSGGFAYERDGDVCGCGFGFHGQDCEFTCSDGISNGAEEALDCGEVCGSECGEGLECNFRGTYTTDSVDYTRPGVSDCDPVSADLCIGRRRIRGLFNAVLETAFDEETRQSPLGSRWMAGTCDSGTPSSTWVVANGSRPPDMVGSPMCMLDESTLLQWDVLFTDWGRGSEGAGAFSYTRQRTYCDCDPGAHGPSCEFSCTDRLRNGEEDAEDCGGPCAACPDRWECAARGDVTGEIERYTFSLPGTSACDPVGPDLCIARAPSGWLVNLENESAATDESPTETTWWIGTCDDPVPSNQLYALFRGRFWQIIHRPLCMTHTSTGILWDITFTSWGRGRDGDPGLFSYVRDSISCACDAGFHGDRCEYSCGDGLLNGDEVYVDCGGPCSPCADDWECQYNGTYAGDVVEVFYTRDDPCDAVSEDVCIDRSRSGGWIYNAVVESSHSAASPTGTLWAPGACSVETPPIYRLGFWRRPGFNQITSAPLCMLDTTTGIRWTINVSDWGSLGTSTAGTFTWTRDSRQCECDEGYHGDVCEHHCLDGLHNGTEDQVDCGGPCSPCTENWECSYNGVLDGERVSYIHDPLADVCDPVRDGLCVSRNAGGGFFNADAESVAGRGTPTGTLWKAEACSGDDELFLRWRSLSEGVTPTLINVDLCMVDAVTGIEWDIFIRYWGRNTSSDPGIFEWNRSYGGCVCDTGWTGDDCSVPLLE